MTIFKYNIRMKNLIIQVFVFLMLFTGCSSGISTEEKNVMPSIKTIETIEEVETLFPTVSPMKEPTISLVPAKLIVNTCSPLSGYPMDDLTKMVSNPYHPPKPGSDDPHQGVDFSVIDADLRIAVKGADVQAILGGVVVMVMKDRFPYGNAILVETPFQEIPLAWAEKLSNQTSPDKSGSTTALTCPPGWDQVENASQELSMYILYAHLENPPEFKPGDQVGCGDGLGSIGDSGNALAPHLHIEMRYGYSGGLAGSMAHYDVSADEQEMRNYCRWRISCWYRTIDPMEMFYSTTAPSSD